MSMDLCSQVLLSKDIQGFIYIRVWGRNIP